MEKYKPYKAHTYSGETPSERPDMRNETKVEQPSTENSAEELEAMEKVREVLNGVNQEVLFDIFREYYGRAGNDPDTLALTSLENIKIIYNPDETAGLYHIDTGPILNAFKLLLLRENLPETDYPDQVIQTLIHEYIHESSQGNSSQKDMSRGLTIHVKNEMRGGVQLQSLESKRKILPFWPWDRTRNEANRAINEGITVMITHDIHAEYTKRIGVGAESQSMRRRNERIFEANTYPDEQLNTKFYIAFLSVAVGVPEDTVKGALIRTYFRNSDIVPKDFNDVLTSLKAEVDDLDFDDYPEIQESFQNEELKKRFDKNDYSQWFDKLSNYLPKEKKLDFLQRCSEIFDQFYKAHDLVTVED